MLVIEMILLPKNVLLLLQPFYGHYAGQPMVAGIPS